MAGTHYGALNFTLEEEKKPQVSSLRKSGAVAAVVVAVCVMFFAGRVHKSMTTPFSHEDIMNVASTCKKGQFIGGCKACQKCQPYEYRNGGCTYFKDTFCTYCDPIPHCDRVNQRCNDGPNQRKIETTCTECECKKHATDYAQKTLEQVEYYQRDWSAAKQKEYSDEKMIYSCFFNNKNDKQKPWSSLPANPNVRVPLTECRACTVCPEYYYRTAKCDPAAGTDTQCRRCRVCKNFQYTSQPCAYDSNTQCGKCLNCKVESERQNSFLWMKENCSSKENRNVYDKGQKGTCALCSSDDKIRTTLFGNTDKNRDTEWFVEKACKPGTYEQRTEKDEYDGDDVTGFVFIEGSAQDVKAGKCTGCKKGFYIADPCKIKVGDVKADKSWAPGADCLGKYRFDPANNGKNCGPFKRGVNDVCQACLKNSGCRAEVKNGKGEVVLKGESCNAGKYSKKANKVWLQGRDFRTKTCDNEPDQNGNARYGVCNTCTKFQYERRSCAAECEKRNAFGRCDGNGQACASDGDCEVRCKNNKCMNGRNHLKACTSQKDCGKVGHSYCTGLCMLRDLANEVVSSTEDGKMAVNREGIQTTCRACPDNFVVGKDENDKPVFASMTSDHASRCDAKFKLCAYAPNWNNPTFNPDGMKNPPAYSTCNGACPARQTQFDKYDNCCKANALGASCGWKHYNKQCLTASVQGGKKKGLPYRKRTKKTGAYKGFRPKGLTPAGTRHPLKADDDTKATGHLFVRWCRQLCEDFPRCTMFSVDRCLVDGTCAVKDSSECDLYKESNPGAAIAADKPAPLDKDTLKKLKGGDIKDTDWTCAMGAAIFANHQDNGPAANPWTGAGFKCSEPDALGVQAFDTVVQTIDGKKKNKQVARKCGTPKCAGAAAKCCVKAKKSCFTKPTQMTAHQQK